MIRSIFIDCGPLPRSDEHSWKAKSDTALQVNRMVFEAYYPRCIGWHPKQEPSSTASGMAKTWDGTPASRFWNVFMVKTSMQPTSLSNTPLPWVLVFGLIYDAFDFDRLWTETDRPVQINNTVYEVDTPQCSRDNALDKNIHRVWCGEDLRWNTTVQGLRCFLIQTPNF